MLELLKKIGVPATVAAVIATLVTITPFIFKIDERYAKQDDLEAMVARNEKIINELTVEIGKLSGTQEVLVTMMAAQESRRASKREPVLDLNNLPASNAGGPAAAPAPKVVQAPAPVQETKKLEAVKEELRSQQLRVQSLKY